MCVCVEERNECPEMLFPFSYPCSGPISVNGGIDAREREDSSVYIIIENFLINTEMEELCGEISFIRE